MLEQDGQLRPTARLVGLNDIGMCVRVFPPTLPSPHAYTHVNACSHLSYPSICQPLPTKSGMIAWHATMKTPEYPQVDLRDT